MSEELQRAFRQSRGRSIILVLGAPVLAFAVRLRVQGVGGFDQPVRMSMYAFWAVFAALVIVASRRHLDGRDQSRRRGYSPLVANVFDAANLRFAASLAPLMATCALSTVEVAAGIAVSAVLALALFPRLRWWEEASRRLSEVAG